MPTHFFHLARFRDLKYCHMFCESSCNELGPLKPLQWGPAMSKKKTIDKKAAKVKTTPADGPDSAFPQESTAEGFPIVGLGASAGGLEALKSFFSEVSEDSAMAFIVLVHLPPKQPSMMPELFQRIARIPVLTARDEEAIEPNHVYVIPPDKEITLYKGRIQLMDIVKRRACLSIDSLLSSLALDQGRQRRRDHFIRHRNGRHFRRERNQSQRWAGPGSVGRISRI